MLALKNLPETFMLYIKFILVLKPKVSVSFCWQDRIVLKKLFYDIFVVKFQLTDACL